MQASRIQLFNHSTFKTLHIQICKHVMLDLTSSLSPPAPSCVLQTPFELACARGDVVVVRAMLGREGKADVNDCGPNNDASPLRWIFKHSNIQAFKHRSIQTSIREVSSCEIPYRHTYVYKCEYIHAMLGKEGKADVNDCGPNNDASPLRYVIHKYIVWYIYIYIQIGEQHICALIHVFEYSFSLLSPLAPCFVYLNLNLNSNHRWAVQIGLGVPDVSLYTHIFTYAYTFYIYSMYIYIYILYILDLANTNPPPLCLCLNGWFQTGGRCNRARRRWCRCFWSMVPLLTGRVGRTKAHPYTKRPHDVRYIYIYSIYIHLYIYVCVFDNLYLYVFIYGNIWLIYDVRSNMMVMVEQTNGTVGYVQMFKCLNVWMFKCLNVWTQAMGVWWPCCCIGAPTRTAKTSRGTYRFYNLTTGINVCMISQVYATKTPTFLHNASRVFICPSHVQRPYTA
jgi:hypothetical protein